jgi:hypothetical protein
MVKSRGCVKSAMERVSVFIKSKRRVVGNAGIMVSLYVELHIVCMIEQKKDAENAEMQVFRIVEQSIASMIR